MTEKRKAPEEQVDEDELEAQKGKPLPDREAMSLINPAPGDMPVDPPLPQPVPIDSVDDA